MNITQRMYFGQFPLDKDRDRRIVFYGRVSVSYTHLTLPTNSRV